MTKEEKETKSKILEICPQLNSGEEIRKCCRNRSHILPKSSETIIISIASIKVVPITDHQSYLSEWVSPQIVGCVGFYYSAEYFHLEVNESSWSATCFHLKSKSDRVHNHKSRLDCQSNYHPESSSHLLQILFPPQISSFFVAKID